MDIFGRSPPNICFCRSPPPPNAADSDGENKHRTDHCRDRYQEDRVVALVVGSCITKWLQEQDTCQ